MSTFQIDFRRNLRKLSIFIGNKKLACTLQKIAVKISALKLSISIILGYDFSPYLREKHSCLYSKFCEKSIFWHWILWKVRFSDTQFCENLVFITVNFVTSPFSSYWIWWRIRFSHNEFYEMLEIGLNRPLFSIHHSKHLLTQLLTMPM